MPVTSRIILAVAAVAILSSGSLANATKCLKATTADELKKAFPILIEGQVVSRQPRPQDKHSFELRIAVMKVLKGRLEEKELSATEVHYGHAAVKRNVYEVGKKYVFPVDLTGKDQQIEIALPQDGCAELPKLSQVSWLVPAALRSWHSSISKILIRVIATSTTLAIFHPFRGRFVADLF